jgi:hypothetical protein
LLPDDVRVATIVRDLFERLDSLRGFFGFQVFRERENLFTVFGCSRIGGGDLLALHKRGRMA